MSLLIGVIIEANLFILLVYILFNFEYKIFTICCPVSLKFKITKSVTVKTQVKKSDFWMVSLTLSITFPFTIIKCIE